MAAPRDVTDLNEKLLDLEKKINNSANKAVNYFKRQLQADGSYKNSQPDLAYYFKSPMMFIAANEMDLAQKSLQYIKTHFMQTNGDFISDEQKSVKSEYTEYWTYTNGWIIRASNQLNDEVITLAAHNYLRQYKTAEGFLTQRLESHSQITDVLTAAHHGLLYLEMNQLNLATEAAIYLINALNNQPKLADGFYLRSEENNNPITEFSSEQAPFYFISKTIPNQLYFMLGYPSAFLALLYKRTNEEKFLAASKAYLDFSLSCCNCINSNFSHKLAWAASLILSITGEAKYLSALISISEQFIQKQNEDGIWYANDLITAFDQSAEIACWFLDIVKNIKTLDRNLLSRLRADLVSFSNMPSGYSIHQTSSTQSNNSKDNQNRLIS